MRIPSILFSIVVLVASTLLSAVSDQAEAAHVFSGVDLRNGKEMTLLREDSKTKATVVVFVSSKCPCSMSHIPELKALARDFADVRFIAINSNGDETVETAGKYFAAQELPFPVLRDLKYQWADEFKAVKTPHAFILDNQGQRLFQGGVSNSAMFPRADRKYLRDTLEDIQAGQTIRTPLARALGCAITRGE